MLVERAKIVERSVLRNVTFYEQQKKCPLQQGGGSQNQPQIKKFQGNNRQWKGQGSNMAPRENEGQPGPRCHKFHLVMRVRWRGSLALVVASLGIIHMIV